MVTVSRAEQTYTRIQREAREQLINIDRFGELEQVGWVGDCRGRRGVGGSSTESS